MSESVLQKTAKALGGGADIKKIAQMAVDLVVRDGKEYGVVASSIYMINSDINKLQGFVFTSRLSSVLGRLIPGGFAGLKLSISAKDNLMVKTAVTKVVQRSHDLRDYGRGAVPDAVSSAVAKALGGKLYVSVPIELRNAQVAGVILYLLNEAELEGYQLEFLKSFAKQLGIAISNARAFERNIESFELEVEKRSRKRNPDDIPTVKFGVRLTPRQDREVKKRAKEEGLTKTELVRSIISEYLGNI